MPDLRTNIESQLQSFTSAPLRQASLDLLSTLGYHSDKTVELKGSKPQAFLDLLSQSNLDVSIDKDKALFADWSSADLLFQLTDEELSGETSLFEETDVKPGLLKSYLFFAIELNGNSAINGTYARGKLTAIARQINRVFPMPVMLLIKHPEQRKHVLSIAVINRRANKRDTHKDVLGKVTIIRDISFTEPHRGHLDILDSFAFPNLRHPEKLPIRSFDTLHAAWEEIFNVELLNKRFYKELANWYFWALPQVDFPSDLEPDDEKRRATGLIRLLTRLIFCWFIKEKGLIPEKLFHRADLADILKDFDPDSCDSSQYYQAILQNLFFATLNQRMGKSSRYFVPDEGFLKNKKTHDLNNYYRYEALFAGIQDDALAHFADIPFLNGGLFECLDRRIEEDEKTYYLDGFSRNARKRPCVPNYLFFADEIKGIDLSDVYHDNRRKTESVSGLIRILNRYKFTIVENTPIDQEIALDPELLGKVFENLLASYNEETKTTARKQTGSFYTPRPIVDYMVDESLKAHLLKDLTTEAGMSADDAQTGLDILFAYTEKEHAFTDSEKNVLIRAIDRCKILDPACGSGAFPMGILHKLVFILGKLDPGNERWKQTQLDKLDSAPMREDLERTFEDNDDDYGRKLFLIENCLYGVDIQPIAIQISKLRFFISLICDQKTNRNKKENHGIRPLPNLETKFVAADTLIGLPEMDQSILIDPRVDQIEKEVSSLYHQHFGIQHRDKKRALQRKIKNLRKELGSILAESLMAPAKAQHVANWDPFDPQASSDFFDPFWMFGIFAGQKTRKDAGTLTGKLSGIIDDELTATTTESDGFDIVIGNPPYVQIQKFPKAQKDRWVAQDFQTYAATADIYCLFYERGAQLLKNGGSLVYITSNKWMRAGYGEKLRKFLSSNVTVNELLDFWGILVFQAATVDTNILRYTKIPAKSNEFSSTMIPKDFNFSITLEDYVAEHSTPFIAPINPAENWAVLSPERLRIRKLVEAQGIPLKKWDIIINYGVKTGLNDAFYVTSKQRDALVAEDPACEKLIVPLLRGRFIDKYGTNWEGEHLINTHNGVKSSGIPPINVREGFPAIWRHLSNWESKLCTRQDKGDHWSNLRNCAYLEDFSKPKIIYPEITKRLGFYYDKNHGFIPNNKGYIVTSPTPHLPYLTAFLNSSLFKCCYKDNFPTQGEDRRELRTIFFELLHVKKPNKFETELFEKLVPLIQLAKAEKQQAAYNLLEALIDACVMECYFREHMAERDLLFQDAVAAQLKSVGQPFLSASSSEKDRQECLSHLYETLQATDLPQKIQAIAVKSPDLLGVILKEGKV